MAQKLSEPDTFVLLGKRRRRLALQVLREATPPLTTTELAERIAEREFESPADRDLYAVRVALHHVHLPRLDDADVVGYDAPDDAVRPGPNFDDLVRVLDQVTEGDLPWSGE